MIKRILLALAVGLVALSAHAATYPNKFDTNSNPESVSWTNTSSMQVNGPFRLPNTVGAGNTSYNLMTIGVGNTNAIRFRTGFITLGNAVEFNDGTEATYGSVTHLLPVHGNFYGFFTGDASGSTNIQGTGFSQGTASLSNTNLNFVLGNTYQRLVLTTNCNVTNVSGVGSGTLFLEPNGGNRVISFPTNWIFLQTNGLALVGSLYSITLTNGPSRGGALSVANVGTNTWAAYLQTP